MSGISQREARRLRKRVAALQSILVAERRSYGQQWVGGTNIASAQYAANDAAPVAIRTARNLGHAVVATVDDTGLVRFMALPHPKVEL